MTTWLRSCLFFLLTLVAAPVLAAELKVFVALAFQPAMVAIATDFEKATGHTVTSVFGTAGVLRDKLRAGEAADAIVVPQSAFEPLRAEGRIAAGSETPIAQSLISIAVRAGAPKPDLASAATLKSALLAARSISYPDPAAGGAVGAHAARTLDKLGITDQMKARTRVTARGEYRDLLMSGEVEFAFVAPATVLDDPRIELAGALPMELQDMGASQFLAGVTANAREPAAARALVQYLASAPAASIIKAKGLQPQTKP